MQAVLDYTKAPKVSFVTHSMGVTLGRKIIKGGQIQASDGKEFLQTIWSEFASCITTGSERALKISFDSFPLVYLYLTKIFPRSDMMTKISRQISDYLFTFYFDIF